MTAKLSSGCRRERTDSLQPCRRGQHDTRALAQGDYLFFPCKALLVLQMRINMPGAHAGLLHVDGATGLSTFRTFHFSECDERSQEASERHRRAEPRRLQATRFKAWPCGGTSVFKISRCSVFSVSLQRICAKMEQIFTRSFAQETGAPQASLPIWTSKHWKETGGNRIDSARPLQQRESFLQDRRGVGLSVR